MNKQLILIALMLATPLKAISLYSHHIPNLITQDEQGSYQKLIQLMINEYSLEPVTYHIQPANRARRSFEDDKEACYIAGDLSWPIPVIQSQAIGGFRIHLFTLKNHPVIRRFSDLKGNIVLGGLTGFKEYYESFIPNSYSISYAFDDTTSLQKLKFARVNALIGVMPDYRIFKDTLDYDQDFILQEGLDFLFCHDNNKGTQFKIKFDEALNKLKINGQYEAIMGYSFLP